MSTRNKKKKSARQAAAWVPDPDSMLHVSCSSCGFRVETVRAVETGWTSSEHVGVKYKFCPVCGRAMHIYKNPA